VTFSDFFERVAVIHLPERHDRFLQINRELSRLGIDAKTPKLQFPFAPRPTDSAGFPSRAVYGNFLSHLGIIRQAIEDRVSNVLVLEDDAMFSRRMLRAQDQIIGILEERAWDMCFFGHSLTKELSHLPKGLVQCNDPFRWAHCYAVNRQAFQPLKDYLEFSMALPVGHPLGGKMYIDGALNHFRQQAPGLISLVANPMISKQRGSPSSIAGTGWSNKWFSPFVQLGRYLRDEAWRELN
jgi:hypothetical protein